MECAHPSPSNWEQQVQFANSSQEAQPKPSPGQSIRHSAPHCHNAFSVIHQGLALFIFPHDWAYICRAFKSPWFQYFRMNEAELAVGNCCTGDQCSDKWLPSQHPPTCHTHQLSQKNLSARGPPQCPWIHWEQALSRQGEWKSKRLRSIKWTHGVWIDWGSRCAFGAVANLGRCAHLSGYHLQHPLVGLFKGFEHYFP